MIRFASLGSGSKGNALVVESGSSRVLLDCGFGPRNLATRLARLGLTPADIDAIIVTHEHSDHIAGAFPCGRQFGYALHMTRGTYAAMNATKTALSGELLSLFDSHAAFAVGDLSIQPFPVPHDAREPVQFVFSDGNRRLGVLTDLGFATPHVVEMLNGCDALVLECNHDETMLAGGDYPPSLKARIGGRYGHLSNRAAADLLASLDRSRLQHLVAAHLSEQNNTPELVRDALAAAGDCDPDWIDIADQELGFDWKSI